jgi:hypothetical protein
MTHLFDELAKALAEEVSRREALRLVGGGLVGAVLTVLGLGRAYGGVDCVAYCVNRHGDSSSCGAPTPPSPQVVRVQCEQACRQCGGRVGRVCRANAQTSAVICCPGMVGCSCVCGDGGA